CFGFPWLAIIHKQLGNQDKYEKYLMKTLSVMTQSGEIPELYYGGTEEWNENTPLGWGQALFLQAVLGKNNIKKEATKRYHEVMQRMPTRDQVQI
ncbi:MAG: hypothetical protein ACE5DM_05865, partial [Candidatus Nanoarchaeia archaeon]